MLLELAVGAAETVLGAKACRWVRLLSAQAEAKQAAVFQAADPLPVASAVRCGNRAGRVQGLLRGRVEAFQLAQEEVEARLRRWSSPVRSNTAMSAAPL